jgi:hypothetical protein
MWISGGRNEMKSFSEVVDKNNNRIIGFSIVGIVFLLATLPVVAAGVREGKTDLTVPIPEVTVLVEPITNPEHNTTFVDLGVSESLVVGTAKLIAGSD